MNFAQAIHTALDESLRAPEVLLCGQLVRHSHSALTRGLEHKYPAQVITFPVSENLMNSAAMGLAMAGKRPVMMHERFDFCIVGMDALANHIALWPKACKVRLPLVMMVIVGHGPSQGPQQNKNFTEWFRSMDGWNIYEPDAPEIAYWQLKHAIFGDSPTLFVIHRNRY